MTETKSKKGRIEITPTALPGVALKTRPEAKAIPLKVIEKFLRLAKKYFRIDWQINKYLQQEREARKPIIQLANEYEGFCGIVSKNDGFSLTVTPKKSISWNIELLKQSLGIAESAVVSYDLLAHITIPSGLTTAKGSISEKALKEAIDNALRDLGIGPGDLNKIRFLETKPRIDEEKLAEMIERGQVELIEGSKLTDTSWAVKAEQLK